MDGYWQTKCRWSRVIESSEDTKLSQWVISLLLNTLLLFAHFLAASEASERSFFPKGFFRIPLMVGYYNFLLLCGQSSHGPFNIYNP